jgi:hypothetical protein
MSPHFIVGMPRAGTTFLVRSLNQHSRVASFGESRFWGNDWVEPGPDGYEREQLDTVIQRLGANPLDTNIGADGPEPDRAGWLSAVGRPDLPELAETTLRPLAVPADPGEVFRLWCATIAEREGKDVAVEKTPHHLRHVDRILRYLPEARFAVIVRDPVEFLLSYKHFGDRKSAEKRAKADQRWDPIGVALLWRAYLRHANQVVDRWPDQVLLIRNEELKSDPVRITGEVATFFGVEAEDEAFREADDLPTNTSFVGDRPTLSGAELSWLRRIAGADAEAAGYSIPADASTVADELRVATGFVPWAVRNLAERSRNTDGSMVAYARKAILG